MATTKHLLPLNWFALLVLSWWGSCATFAFAPHQRQIVVSPKQSKGFIASSSSLAAQPETDEYQEDQDAKALLDASDFPIAPDDLIDLAKKVQYEKQVGILDNGDCLADDIVFRAAVVELKGKERYLNAVSALNFTEFFDVNSTIFGWHVDPLMPNRVYYNAHSTAVHSNKEFFGAKPDGKTLTLPPQLFHMDFSPDGKVKEFGFYTVDRNYGNTGGLGGAYAYFYGVGRPLPFPEARPYRKSLRRRIFDTFAYLADRMAKKKNQNKKEE